MKSVLRDFWMGLARYSSLLALMLGPAESMKILSQPWCSTACHKAVELPAACCAMLRKRVQIWQTGRLAVPTLTAAIVVTKHGLRAGELPGMEVRRLLSAMRRCSFRRLPTSADRLDSLFPETRSSLRFVNAPMPTAQRHRHGNSALLEPC